jgi:hypothetical protein
MFVATLVGNLGKMAPEKKLGKNGSHYYFTMALNEMAEGKELAVWVHVRVFDEGLFDKVAKLVKGETVCVNGNFSVTHMSLTGLSLTPLGARVPKNSSGESPIATKTQSGGLSKEDVMAMLEAMQEKKNKTITLRDDDDDEDDEPKKLDDAGKKSKKAKKAKRE